MDKTLFRGKLNKSSKIDTSKDIFIEGIMSTPVVDLENEIIGRESYPNAISEIKLRKANSKPIPIFVEHRRKEWSLPVGTLEDAKETENGLWFKAKIIGGPDGSYLDTVQRLIKAGALYGCSIGGDALKSQLMYDSSRQSNVKKITQMDLRELSLTGMPVNQGSSFSIAKSLSGKNKIVKSEWRKEVSSLYKSLDGIINKEMSGSKIKKSINSLDNITKALEETIEQGENVNDVDILDKIKGALTDLADLLGIQDLVDPSAGEGSMGLEGMGDEGMGGEEMPMDNMEEPQMEESQIEEGIPEENNMLPEEQISNDEEITSEEAPDEFSEEMGDEEEIESEEAPDEFSEEGIEEELDEEAPIEEELEEGIEDEEELQEDQGEMDEDVEELQEDRDELSEDIQEGANEEEIFEGEEEIDEGEEELEEDADEISEDIEEGMEDEEGLDEELEEGNEEIADIGDELMSDNVEDIELKLDKILQLLSKQGKNTNTKKIKKEKEKSFGGDTMGKDKKIKTEKAKKVNTINKSTDIVGVRGEQSTTPEGSDVVASQHPHNGDSTGNGQENFDIAVAENPTGAQVEVGQKDHTRSDANTVGNDNIAIAENPTGSNQDMSKHPYSVYKCSNPKCATEFNKSEDYDPNFCTICGNSLDKYVYATDEQIQVLKDLEILQDMPSENTGYAVSDFTSQDGSFVTDKMKAVHDKKGNDISEQANDRNIQYGGEEIDGYGHDGHEYNQNGSFKEFLEGANNEYSKKYSEGSQAYNGPKGVPTPKPYVGHTVKSQEENSIEKSELKGDLDPSTKASIEKSIMNGLLEHTNTLMGKIDTLEKSVKEMKDQPIKKSVQTTSDIRKSQEIIQKGENQVWASAFGFGQK